MGRLDTHGRKVAGRGNGIDPVAIRPCGVYGIDPNLERSYAFGLLRRLIKGEQVDKPGGGKFVHVEDVARATVAALDNKEFAGQPVNLVDCYARWADWTRMAAKALGVEMDVDLSSPAQPKNTFTKTQAQRLGVSLDKGHAGIARYIDELIKVHPDCADH